MKKQTLVILAILAVMTTLLTVNALSNEVGYKLSLCDAIAISIGNATVTDFLNGTDKATVQVYNSKRYEGDNIQMVQWSSSDKSLDVYVNVTTGYIAGIEEITVPEALKNWIVANYGDGTRVTSDSADRLIDAMMMSNLAALPTGYTEASITEDVWKWALDNVGWTSSTPPVTPPITPPVTPTEPPDAIKAWIVANYGDGTRVTSDGWRRLSDAEMANALAPLPAGYTKADITGAVISWAIDNPNWEVQTICGWINSIGVTNLTEDHGLYVYNLAIGWTTLADQIYNMLSPKPSKLPAALATEDNGRAVYGYARGWNTIANRITGCNFWTIPTSTKRVIDTVEIGVEIVGPTPTPTEPPDAIKTWIVANYGHGMHVSSLGWLKLSDARNSGTLAPLPAGYTSANITQEVVTWAKNNPDYTISSAAPTPRPTPETKTWHPVVTFRGRNSKYTPAFSIQGDMWRMNWKTVGREDDSSIGVGVYEITGFMPYVDGFAQDTFPFGSDTFYMYDGLGSYILHILPTNLESWEIEIEDFF
jgi:hypothetical protein